MVADLAILFPVPGGASSDSGGSTAGQEEGREGSEKAAAAAADEEYADGLDEEEEGDREDGAGEGGAQAEQPREAAASGHPKQQGQQQQAQAAPAFASKLRAAGQSLLGRLAGLLCGGQQHQQQGSCAGPVADLRPIFVTGLPRSGSTLIEQILSRWVADGCPALCCCVLLACNGTQQCDSCPHSQPAAGHCKDCPRAPLPSDLLIPPACLPTAAPCRPSLAPLPLLRSHPDVWGAGEHSRLGPLVTTMLDEIGGRQQGQQGRELRQQGQQGQQVAPGGPAGAAGA